MLRALPFLLLLGAVIAAGFWVARRAPIRRSLPMAPSAVAVLAYGPDAGSGRLSVTPSQLVFTADSGRVLVVERLDITGATVARDLPDRTTSAPVLVVSTEREAHYFVVDQPEFWVRRLT